MDELFELGQFLVCHVRVFQSHLDRHGRCGGTWFPNHFQPPSLFNEANVVLDFNIAFDLVGTMQVGKIVVILESLRVFAKMRRRIADRANAKMIGQLRLVASAGDHSLPEH